VTGGPPRAARVAIVGSGFGGLGAAIRLQRDGIDDFIVLERAADVGGTWRDNTYPGCACDVESHLYSLSFAPEAGWTRRFSTQPEIWRYLQRCAHQFDLMRRIWFDTEVLGAEWRADEAIVDGEPPGGWRIATSRGPVRARVLVLATGPLSAPHIPHLAGLERFEGRAFHSARWDHGCNLAGKRIAVVGTGASAIQFIPEIQKQAAALVVFQRTPAWVIRRPDATIPEWRRRIYARVPIARLAARLFVYLYREAWIVVFRHPAVMARLQRLAVRSIARSVADETLRAKLTPRYAMGCKRILLSNDYYPALTQPNVELVTESIAEVRGRAIVTTDGIERTVDAIIFGTGFRVTDPPIAERIRGRDGRTLRDAWAGSPKAHLGTTVAGFPNLFLLLGPNTGLGHNSVVYMTEAQIDHLIAALRYMRRHRIGALEPTAAAQQAFVADVDRRMRGTVWVDGGCRSWYLDRTGRNSTLWPGTSWSYYRRASSFRPRDYITIDAAVHAG
jgi:cation diffusion facilitator CzcD-associated flavoprotein CzcO